MKHKPKSKPHSHTVRLSDAEEKIITSDIANMVSHGATPVTAGAYCKHAALSHGRLRKIESLVRETMLTGADDKVRTSARRILEAVS